MAISEVSKIKKTKEKSIKVEDKSVGFIAYTDGGCRPTNPGFGGYGFHGYIYSDQPPKKGTGNPKIHPTAEGYSDKKSDPAVKPLHYIDGYGSIAGQVTNNVAEITAASWALKQAQEYPLEKVTIITDSKGVVEAANTWIGNWMRNDWTKSDGSPVANKDYWIHLNDNMDVLRKKGIQVEFKWIKGHNDHVGNEAADKLATMGVMRCRKGETFNQVTTDPPEGYWNKVPDRHPLLNHRTLYMASDATHHQAGAYFLGNHGKEDELLGTRRADGAYAYVVIPPDPAVETVRTKIADMAKGRNTVLGIKLDQVFERETHGHLLKYGDICLYQSHPIKLDLCFLDKTPVVTDYHPPRLSLRAVDSLNELKEIFLRITVNHDPLFIHTDITKELYDVEKGKLVLKKDMVVGQATWPVEVDHPLNNIPVKLDLALGIDCPGRNALKKMEDLNPKIEIVVWADSERMIRYACLCTMDDATGIYAGMYSNTRFL